jgi:hypothetical protein
MLTNADTLSLVFFSLFPPFSARQKRGRVAREVGREARSARTATTKNSSSMEHECAVATK